MELASRLESKFGLTVIENVLMTHFPCDNGKGPALAVEAAPTDDRPDIVLFTTFALTREEANGRIKEAGLSPLHNIRIMREMDAIPVLGRARPIIRYCKR